MFGFPKIDSKWSFTCKTAFNLLFKLYSNCCLNTSQYSFRMESFSIYTHTYTTHSRIQCAREKAVLSKLLLEAEHDSFRRFQIEIVTKWLKSFYHFQLVPIKWERLRVRTNRPNIVSKLELTPNFGLNISISQSQWNLVKNICQMNKLKLFACANVLLLPMCSPFNS